ncbi:hypothetical protein SAMN04488239_12642 [Ruegeria marina]|uniref:Uncharacterized protein n=1 Tax=Ruegeria marina TaxID=639004 RepID=A0A1G7EQZ8_9RHOB|nr:hypothetical protein SAMN04488239_12642 [Ruegeria marina]
MHFSTPICLKLLGNPDGESGSELTCGDSPRVDPVTLVPADGRQRRLLRPNSDDLDAPQSALQS